MINQNLVEAISSIEYFIIAEIGMNHDGSFGNAIRLIDEAKKAGVNAIKFQLHISEAESLIDAPKPYYFKVEERFEYFNRTAFSLDEWKRLKDYAHNLDLYFIVSPFSHQAVDILEKVEIDGYKIASGETTNIPLLKYINSKNKPVLLSSGMSNWKELEQAANILKDNLLILFQCSSEYPCKAESVGLNIINEMKKRFSDIVIGFSDHTLTSVSAIAAFVMGAKVFEKHFTLSKAMYGADARFSLEPKEMADFVIGLDFINRSLQNPVNKDQIEKYADMKKIFEKSIVAARYLNEGHRLSFEDLNFKKPGDGIRADKYEEIIGKVLKNSLSKDNKILFKHLI